MSEEILDLINEHDEVIGTMSRSEVDRLGLSYQTRAVWLFIKNFQGKYWIPRRVKTKAKHPYALDGSASGCVSSGETYEQALHRETMEEINLDLFRFEYRCIGILTPQEHNTMCRLKIYEITSDEVPHYDSAEFCEYFWLTPQELWERINDGELHKSDLAHIVKNLLITR